MKNFKRAFPALLATPLILSSMLMPVAARAETNSIEALFHRSAESLLPPANIDQCSISGFGSGEFHNQKTATLKCPDSTYKVAFVPGSDGKPMIGTEVILSVGDSAGDTEWRTMHGKDQFIDPSEIWDQATVAVTKGGEKTGIGLMVGTIDTNKKKVLEFESDGFGSGAYAYKSNKTVADNEAKFMETIRSRVVAIGQKVSSAYNK